MNIEILTEVKSLLYKKLNRSIKNITSLDLLIKAGEIIWKEEEEEEGEEEKIINEKFQDLIRWKNLFDSVSDALTLILGDPSLKESVDWSSPVEIANRIKKVLSDEWERQIEDVNKKEMAMNKNIRVPNVSTPCKHCGKKTVYLRSKNTRSFDEPATLIYSCLSCGHGWLNY